MKNYIDICKHYNIERFTYIESIVFNLTKKYEKDLNTISDLLNDVQKYRQVDEKMIQIKQCAIKLQNEFRKNNVDMIAELFFVCNELMLYLIINNTRLVYMFRNNNFVFTHLEIISTVSLNISPTRIEMDHEIFKNGHYTLELLFYYESNRIHIDSKQYGLNKSVKALAEKDTELFLDFLLLNKPIGRYDLELLSLEHDIKIKGLLSHFKSQKFQAIKFDLTKDIFN